ncbi:MAG TPA: hypothetical protein VGK04_08095 [Thermoanaerobaculia bacterium]|jgi:hypothetical protein
MLDQKVAWPEGKRFAFTIFDDPDSQTLEAGREVYAFLSDCGLRTTKAVWPLRGDGVASDDGITCDDPGSVAWLKSLQEAGFEIGYHNATSHTSDRSQTVRGLDRFASLFGHDPQAMANHYYCDEDIYWGEHRLTGINRVVYNLLTRGRNRERFAGHVPGHPYFWGDLCQQRIKYVRNFVFADINTLKACPFMPYHDPLRPYVNYWYASSEGSKVSSFNECIRESEQDRLEEEQGACIMYTHFGHGYYEDGKLNARFRSLVERLSRKNGWFVPVTTLLDFLAQKKSAAAITDQQRTRLERRWLLHKIRFGTA